MALADGQDGCRRAGRAQNRRDELLEGLFGKQTPAGGRGEDKGSENARDRTDPEFRDGQASSRAVHNPTAGSWSRREFQFRRRARQGGGDAAYAEQDGGGRWQRTDTDQTNNHTEDTMKQGPHNNKRMRRRGNGRRLPNPRNQSFDSNGPDVKVRGNAQQVVDKYLALARDASSSGDRIAAESYYQHAEHYFRILNSANVPNNRRYGGGNAGAGTGEPGQAQNAPAPSPVPADLNGGQPEVMAKGGAGHRNPAPPKTARDPANEPQPQVFVAEDKGDAPAAEAKNDEAEKTAGA